MFGDEIPPLAIEKPQIESSRTFSGLFFTKAVLLPPQVGALTKKLKDAEPFDWQPHLFLQWHRQTFVRVLKVIRALFVHELLISEMILELSFFHIHHQIKTYRENLDNVLEELVDEQPLLYDMDFGYAEFF